MIPSADAVPPPKLDAGSLRVLAVNPLDHAAAIKELFAAHGDQEWNGFSEFFDSAYPDAVAVGARSWIGLDRDDKVVMHGTVFPHGFTWGERALEAGLMANMMVAQPYRTFFPARALVSRIAQDCKEAGRFDLLYGTPTPAAEAVLRTAGHRSIGRYGRFVLPIGTGKWYTEPALRAYTALARAARGMRRAVVVRRDIRDADAYVAAAPSWPSQALRGFYSAATYRRRLGRFPGPGVHQFLVYPGSTEARPAGEVVVRGPDEAGGVGVVSLRTGPSVPAAGVLLALVPALRRMGGLRVSISALAESLLGREIARAGFSLRDWRPTTALAISPLGHEVVEGSDRWELSFLDTDA